MRNLFPKTFLVTCIAVGALWAGTLHAQVADFVQVNLVSDIPGLATDPTTGKHRGTIRIDVGKRHTPGGLWTLDFGIGGNNGDPNTLYFTDGINGEANGLFGAIFANGNGS